MRYLPSTETRSARLDANGERIPVSELSIAGQLLGATGHEPKAAIIQDGRNTSYGELRVLVRAYVSELRRAGVRSADRVAISLPNGAEFAAVWLAIQWIGAIAVQLPIAYRRREIARVLSDSDTRLVVSDRPAADFAASTTRVPVLPPRRLPIEAGPQDDIEPAFYRSGDPALITYVTTAQGALVGAVHSAGDLFATCDAYSKNVLNLCETDVCVGSSGWSWAYGLGALLMFPLHAGATTVSVADSIELLPAIRTHRATVLFGVPTTYRILMGHPALHAADLTSLRLCVSAGEPLPADVARSWHDRTGLEILDGFGTTELTHICISARSGAVRPGVVGVPVAGYRVKIVDEAFGLLRDGVPGLLAVIGPTGATYWNDETMQRRRVRDGWTLTGDVCIRHGDGSIEYVRRADTLIVSGGHKISPLEVEDLLNRHPEVESASVFGVPDAMRGNIAEATVRAAAGSDRTTLADRLQEHLKRELAAFKCPRAIRIC
jgi:2-aminobenzoate-CoA ligase